MTATPDSLGGGTSPLVSLIMPVWSPHPSWLREAVAGALNQVGCAIELIVVDDGCDTPVAELLASVDDPRLQVLRVPHGRVSRARNDGVAAAHGDYFRFIDCDDVIVADSTAHLLGLADGRDLVVAYGATLVCDRELRPYSRIESTLQGDAAERCLLNRFDTTIHSLLFPRRVVDEIGPWEPAIVVSQDWDYALRAFEIAPVRGDTRVATYYRMHGAMNSRDVAEGIRGYRMVVDRYFERHPEQRSTRLHRRANALFHLFAATQLATSLHRYRRALGHLTRAFTLDPVTSVAALPRHGAIPLIPAAGRARRLLTSRRRSRP